MNRPQQRRCRRCGKTRTGSRINAFRICVGCQPGWEDTNSKRAKLSSALSAAYQKLTEHGVGEDGCDICGRHPQTRRLSVDHNHITQEVRGLLCYKCNIAMGWFDDSPERLNAAIGYLSRKALLVLDLERGTVKENGR